MLKIHAKELLFRILSHFKCKVYYSVALLHTIAIHAVCVAVSHLALPQSSAIHLPNANARLGINSLRHTHTNTQPCAPRCLTPLHLKRSSLFYDGDFCFCYHPEWEYFSIRLLIETHGWKFSLQHSDWNSTHELNLCCRSQEFVVELDFSMYINPFARPFLLRNIASAHLSGWHLKLRLIWEKRKQTIFTEIYCELWKVYPMLKQPTKWVSSFCMEIRFLQAFPIRLMQ